MKSKWVYFKLVENKTTTSVWEVISKQYGYELGEISWHRGWRQYVFIPVDETMYSKGCLNDISKFIEELMIDRNNTIVQVLNPKTKRYVKIDKSKGKILSHKQSDGPYKNIRIVKE